MKGEDEGRRGWRGETKRGEVSSSMQFVVSITTRQDYFGRTAHQKSQSQRKSTKVNEGQLESTRAAKGLQHSTKVNKNNTIRQWMQRRGLQQNEATGGAGDPKRCKRG